MRLLAQKAVADVSPAVPGLRGDQSMRNALAGCKSAAVPNAIEPATCYAYNV